MEIKEIKNLGIIKSREEVTITFDFPKVEEIKDMESSCGCSKPIKDLKNKSVVVKYTPDRVPLHLKDQGTYITSKQIVITLKDDSIVLLKFNALIED